MAYDVTFGIFPDHDACCHDPFRHSASLHNSDEWPWSLFVIGLSVSLRPLINRHKDTDCIYVDWRISGQKARLIEFPLGADVHCQSHGLKRQLAAIGENNE